jgi:hypothetical protein
VDFDSTNYSIQLATADMNELVRIGEDIYSLESVVKTLNYGESTYIARAISQHPKDLYATCFMVNCALIGDIMSILEQKRTPWVLQLCSKARERLVLSVFYRACFIPWHKTIENGGSFRIHILSIKLLAKWRSCKRGFQLLWTQVTTVNGDEI